MPFKRSILEQGKEILTSGYGYRTIDGERRMHYAIDCVSELRGKDGHRLADRIIAIETGVVIKTAYDSSRGYYIQIKHAEMIDKDVISHYQHLKKGSFLVKVGDFVKRGQPIATMGYTGQCVPPNSYAGRHLDFRILIGSTKVNPLPYLQYEYILPCDYLIKAFKVKVKVPKCYIREQINGEIVRTERTNYKLGTIITIHQTFTDKNGLKWGRTIHGWVKLSYCSKPIS